MATGPKSLGPAAPGAADAGNIARITSLEKEVGHLKKALDFVQNTNWLIIIVLFVGVIALIITAFNDNSNASHQEQAAQEELIKTMQQLTDQMNTVQSNNAKAAKP